MLYIETYIVPVCRFEVQNNTVNIRAFHGTAFFINSEGAFLSATHVISSGEEDVKRHGGFLGLCVRIDSGNIASRILHCDLADNPYDICVGEVSFKCETLLTFQKSEISTWRDVATFGYPTNSQNISLEQFWMYGRGFKGYIHRLVKSNQFPNVVHPDSFETNSAMPRGLSGSPLFVHNEPKDIVVGICVGANSSETLDFMFEEVNDAGEIFREKKVRVEEYGLAHDIRSLFEWRPSGFSGRTLFELGANEHVRDG